ncbi:unnamed protein product [Ixodes pacificus]
MADSSIDGRLPSTRHYTKHRQSRHHLSSLFTHNSRTRVDVVSTSAAAETHPRCRKRRFTPVRWSNSSSRLFLGRIS